LESIGRTQPHGQEQALTDVAACQNAFHTVIYDFLAKEAFGFAREIVVSGVSPSYFGSSSASMQVSGQGVPIHTSRIMVLAGRSRRMKTETIKANRPFFSSRISLRQRWRPSRIVNPLPEFRVSRPTRSPERFQRNAGRVRLAALLQKLRDVLICHT
jgi:hypothetical protein